MDDEFNVIGGDEELAYPSDEVFANNTASVHEPTVLTELNGIGRKSVKRRFNEEADDSFVHPIDWHMSMSVTFEEREAKRQKQLIEEDVIDRMTSKIIETRNKRLSIQKVEEIVTPEIADEDKLLRYPPSDGSDWIGVSTDTNDARFYIRYRKKKTHSRNFDENKKSLRSVEALHQLLTEEKELREQNTRKLENERLRQTLPSTSAEPSDTLWVNKYSPTNFPDLLGDDAINRNVLIWLKLWDECVFKKKVNEIENLVSEKDRNIYCLDGGKPRRPNNKILLLSGPAGLGKTTLAGVIAKHCGYATVELNASDSRNISDFDRVIEGALRSSRNIDSKSGGKPNCLILDEIDGAPVEAIRFLVKIIQLTGRKAIRRPIICICNNLFTPALRELRAIALNVTVLPTRKERLIERLVHIANREQVRIDHAALGHLIERCHCDVRLSLNLLQYVSYAARAERKLITLSDIEKAAERENVGSESIFENWATILDFTHHLDNKGVLHTTEKRMKTIEKVVSSCGDDRFVTGLHSNFIRLPLPIGILNRTMELFLFYDRLNVTIAQTQNYGLMRYLFTFYCQLHMVVATHHKAALKYPQLEQTVVQRSRESIETVNAVRATLVIPNNPTSLITDILPLLVTIVQPALKPMNEYLYSARDLKIIANIVKIMCGFNLTYTASTINGQVQYTFLPPVDVLTLYNLNDVNHRVCLPNTMRQLIVKKIDLCKKNSKIEEALGCSGTTNNDTVPAVPSTKAMDHILPKKEPTNKVPLHYKYNQGFSNAVKKSIRMSYFVM